MMLFIKRSFQVYRSTMPSDKPQCGQANPLVSMNTGCGWQHRVWLPLQAQLPGVAPDIEIKFQTLQLVMILLLPHSESKTVKSLASNHNC